MDKVLSPEVLCPVCGRICRSVLVPPRLHADKKAGAANVSAQVQEMTLVFVPKMLAVGIVLLASGGWMLQTAVAFGTRMFESIGS
jgi:hypothetical protein